MLKQFCIHRIFAKIRNKFSAVQRFKCLLSCDFYTQWHRIQNIQQLVWMKFQCCSTAMYCPATTKWGISLSIHPPMCPIHRLLWPIHPPVLSIHFSGLSRHFSGLSIHLSYPSTSLPYPSTCPIHTLLQFIHPPVMWVLLLQQIFKYCCLEWMHTTSKRPLRCLNF